VKSGYGKSQWGIVKDIRVMRKGKVYQVEFLDGARTWYAENEISPVKAKKQAV
jgi:hypothetical protein